MVSYFSYIFNKVVLIYVNTIKVLEQYTITDMVTKTVENRGLSQVIKTESKNRRETQS